jgi:hypothetical protein
MQGLSTLGDEQVAYLSLSLWPPSCRAMSLLGTNRTSRTGLAMSVDWGRPEVVD